MTPLPEVPGRGLTRFELGLLRHDSPERLVWSGLAEMAKVLGLPITTTDGPGQPWRACTVDELLTTLDGYLPAGADVAAMAQACHTLCTDKHSPDQVTYEVRHLRQHDGQWRWQTIKTLDDQEAALDWRAAWVERTGEVYAVVQVTTSANVRERQVEPPMPITGTRVR